MGSALDLLKLTDRYERKARLLPALLSGLVIVPAVAAVSSDALGRVAGLSVGVGFMAVCAMALSYAASAAGRRFERKLWPRWPHDAPTNRWLRPDDDSSSQKQKQLWYSAIERLVSLDIPSVAAQGDRAELERIINDAVRALRHQFRNTEFNGLLVTHNEDYGFARNLAGLRLFWLPAAGVGFAATWAAYFVGTSISWALASSSVLILCVALALALPGYVRQRAERYAESFFGTLVQVDQNKSVLPQMSNSARCKHGKHGQG